MSKYQNDFYCLNCLDSFATENKRESHKLVRKNKDIYNVVMTSKDTETLEFTQYQKLINHHLLFMQTLNV